MVAPPGGHDGGPTASSSSAAAAAAAVKARAYRAALPAQWDERGAVHVQTFLVENASPSSVATALWSPSSSLIRSLHVERGHADLVVSSWSPPWNEGGETFALAVGAKRSISFTSPSPAPAIAPGPCWQNDLQELLFAPTQQQQQKQQHGPSATDGDCYVMQSDVRTGAPYGEHIAVLGRTAIAAAHRHRVPSSAPDDNAPSPCNTVVHVSYCVKYGAGISRMVRPIVSRGVDGGVRSTYAALRKGLPAALMAAKMTATTTAPVAIRDLPPAAPLPPALRAAFESLGASGAAPSWTTASASAAPAATAAAAGVHLAADATAGGHAAAATSSPVVALPMLLEAAFLLPSASAARALAALVGDPLLFARCAVGLLSLVVLSAALRAVRWLLARAPLLMTPLAHAPESVAQALTGALLLAASNRAVGALLDALAAAFAAPPSSLSSPSGGVILQGTSLSEHDDHAVGTREVEQDHLPPSQRRSRRPFGRSSTSGGGGGGGAAADMAADLAAATATKLRSAADKARTSVAAQLRPRASGSGGGALLREQQQELDKEAARRLRQRMPAMPRPPDEPATAELLLGGAPLTLVEDYVPPPAAGEAAHALAPVDLLYERRKPRRRDGAGASASSDKAAAAAPPASSRSPSPPLPRSPSMPAASPSGSGRAGPSSVRGVAWASASLASRSKAAVPAAGASPSEGGGDGPFLVLGGAGAGTSSPADLALLAALPDGHAPAAAAAARAASGVAAVARATTVAADDNDDDNEGEEDEDTAATNTVAGTVTDADLASADHSEGCLDGHGVGGGNDDDDQDEDEPLLQQLFENERRQAWGWGHMYPGSFLPSDRCGRWSDREGRPGGNASARLACVAAAQPPAGYVWAPGSRWRLDVTGREEGAVDDQGWGYAVDFPQLLALPSAERCGWPPLPPGKAGRQNFVRRRRWVRALMRAEQQQRQEQQRPASSPVHSPSRAASAPLAYDDSSESGGGQEEEPEEAERSQRAVGAPSQQRQRQSENEEGDGAGCTAIDKGEEEHAAAPCPPSGGPSFASTSS